jgi:glyoxylase-like metal-dependent hydrolase (beta-lactamase superfamily II)
METPMKAVILTAVAALGVITSATARQAESARDLVNRAAEALGGRDRLLALRTITIEGYGQLAYQNGGGNITSSPDAPQKWIDVNSYSRVIDLQNMRTRVRQRQVYDFVFAAAQQMRGVVSTQGLDGIVAYNVNAAGVATRAPIAAAQARRMEMLAHPIVAVREALASSSRVVRAPARLMLDTGFQGVVPDQLRVEVSAGVDTFMLAIDPMTSLPQSVSWVGPDQNLGDVEYRTAFTGYQPVSGVMMPTGFNTTINFRNVVQQKLYVDRHAVDASTEDLAAPASVRAAPAPARPTPKIGVTEIAKGIWYLTGAGNSTLFEFDDHLTLFEAYGSEANAQAIFETARALVPRKPLTEVIVSHHHFDHTGGLRAAAVEGLTIVAQRGNEAFLREVTARPGRVSRVVFGKDPRQIQVRAVDDHLKLRDNSMEIDIYRVVANSHMADGLMVYVPRDRLLVQGDLFDVNWEIYWWGSSYVDNVRHRKLQVDRDVPVHGRVLPFAEVQQHIDRQIKAAQALCASVEAAGLSMRGCPVKTTVDR